MMKSMSFTVLFVIIFTNSLVNQAYARGEIEPQSLAKFKKYNIANVHATQDTIKIKATLKPNVNIIHQGYSDQNYDFSAKSLMVISTRDSYERELYKHSSDAVESINFEQQQVLIIDSGNQPNSGNYLSITDIKEYDDFVEVIVTLNVENPNDECFYPSAIVHPYKFYTVDSTKQILFREQIKMAPKC